MKKIFNYILTIILLVFSFYYTNIVSNYIKEKDPIMITLKQNINSLNKNYIDAIIINDTIIPGKCGQKVNINKSYKKMKRLNKYYENYLVFDKINPTISLKNNYDKLIINGNLNNNNIAILLKINDLEILNLFKNNSYYNIILDDQFITNNLNYLTSFNNNIIVNEKSNTYNLNIIDYCYSNNFFYKYCSNYNIYTIKPNFINNNYYYNTYKILQNGSILAYKITNKNDVKKLEIIVKAIKNLKYNIVSLDKLIEE